MGLTISLLWSIQNGMIFQLMIEVTTVMLVILGIRPTGVCIVNKAVLHRPGIRPYNTQTQGQADDPLPALNQGLDTLLRHDTMGTQTLAMHLRYQSKQELQSTTKSSGMVIV